MGLASFLFGRKVQRTMLGDFMVDVTISMVTDLSAKVSKNPIAVDSSSPTNQVTDHVSLDGLVFKIEGVISQSPLGDLAGELQAILGGVAGGFVGNAASKAKIGGGGIAGTGLGAIIGSSLGGGLGKFMGARDDSNYPKTAMNLLIKSFESRQPFMIRTFFQDQKKNNIYDPMLITHLSFPQEAKDGNSLRFSLTAERISIVSLQVGVASGDYIKGLQAANSAQPDADLGRQGEEKAKESSKKRVSELLEFGRGF